MAVFNQTFFDLNEKRGYCVDGAAGLPPDTISDLKISVPNRTESIRMVSLFSRDESVRIVFVAVTGSREKPVAHFSSDTRSMIRIGTPYPLTSPVEGYGGLIVFGEGIRNGSVCRLGANYGATWKTATPCFSILCQRFAL